MSLSIVQSGGRGWNATDTDIMTVHWPSTPTNGNLLICAGCCYDSTQPSPENGWTALTTNQLTSVWDLFVFYKYASSSSQNEAISSLAVTYHWSISFWEISGITGTIVRDVVGIQLAPTIIANSGSSPTMTSITTLEGATLMLGAFGFVGAPDYVTAGTVSEFTADASYFSTTEAGGNGNCYAILGHIASPSGSYTPSLSLTSSGNSEGSCYSTYIQLGPKGTPWLDGLGATTPTILGNASTIEVTGFDTYAAEDVVVVFIASTSSSASRTVSGISGGSLSWSRRNSYSPSSSFAMEEWWAPAASVLSNATIEVTMSGTCGLLSMTIFAVGGAYDYTDPFDSNDSLVTNSSYTDEGSGGSWEYSTSQATDLIIAIAGGTFGYGVQAPTDWVALEAFYNAGGLTYSVGSLNVSSVQTDQYATYAALHSGIVIYGWVDAIAGSSAVTVATFGQLLLAAL